MALIKSENKYVFNFRLNSLHYVCTYVQNSLYAVKFQRSETNVKSKDKLLIRGEERRSDGDKFI